MKRVLITIGIFVGITILILLSVYIAMFISTNSIMNYAKDVFSGETIIENEENPLWRYSFKENFFPETETIEYELKRLYVFHDFNQGKIRVMYRLRYLDKNDNTLTYSLAQATWYIKKDGGKWIVYDIDEAP